MTQSLPFGSGDKVPVRALCIGERIDLRAFDGTSKYAVAPLTVTAGARGVAVMFRYGVVVLYNVAPIEEAALLEQLAPLVSQRFETPELEEAVLAIEPDKAERGADGVINLSAYDPDRLQTVADVLAKSVVLAFYEKTINAAFEGIEPLAEDLTRRGTSRRSSKELLRHIGGALLIQTKTVWRVEITDKPEALWERPDLEILYTRLVDEYELTERHVALERKLELITRTASTALELLHNNRSLRVEWYIVALIVADIILSLYEMFLR
jgi:uncharacterized Rmd1/YagE family protein